MAGFDKYKRGVDWYLKATIHKDIFFPEGKVKCQNCPYCYPEQDLKRFKCRIENKIIYSPFEDGVPEWCPADSAGEVVGKKEDK